MIVILDAAYLQGFSYRSEFFLPLLLVHLGAFWEAA